MKIHGTEFAFFQNSIEKQKNNENTHRNIEHIFERTKKKAHHIFQFGSSVCCSLVGVRWQETVFIKLLFAFTYTRKMCREVEIYL